MPFPALCSGCGVLWKMLVDVRPGRAIGRVRLLDLPPFRQQSTRVSGWARMNWPWGSVRKSPPVSCGCSCYVLTFSVASCTGVGRCAEAAEWARPDSRSQCVLGLRAFTGCKFPRSAASPQGPRFPSRLGSLRPCYSNTHSEPSRVSVACIFITSCLILSLSKIPKFHTPD